MRPTLAGCAVLLAAVASAGCAARAPSVLGRQVTLVPVEKKDPKVKGELLAFEQGRLWVRTEAGLRDVDPASLREVRVQRHTLNGKWAIRWGLLGGLASGVAMAAACSTVQGNSAGGCAGAGAVFGGVWALMGLLAAPSLEASSQVSFMPESTRLKPYARFPAGLPKGVAPESLDPGPPPPK